MGESKQVVTCGHKRLSWGRALSDCNRPAKVERNGTPYCGVHDPVRLAAVVKKNDDERTAAWERRCKSDQARRAAEAERDRKAAAYDTLHAQIAEAREALRHAVQRNHDYAPDACSGCESARNLLDANAREGQS